MSTHSPSYEDYRSSHQGRGWDYHQKFNQEPVRAAVWQVERLLLDAILRDRFADPKQVRLLDFACGTGRVLDHLASKVNSATGVDVAASMLDVARSISPDVELHCLDLTDPAQLADRSFDMITAFRFFPNAEPDLRDSAMAALRCHLAPGGIIVFNNHLRHSGITMRVRRAVGRVSRPKSDRFLFAMRDDEVSQLAARHGLRIAARHYAGIVPVLKEKRSLLPEAWLPKIEGWAADSVPAKLVANDVIYVLE